MLHKLTVNTDK